MPNSAIPKMISWALKRAGKEPDDADLRKFQHVIYRNEGDPHPTFDQLADFADAVYVPVGYLLRDRPPVELPSIFYFGADIKLSLAAKDAIDACVLQRDWYREQQLNSNKTPIAFVGRADLTDEPQHVASEFSARLALGLMRKQRKRSNLGHAFKLLRRKAEDVGVLVVVNEYVLNTSRALNAEEFSGCAIFDEYAPLVFVNSAASISRQIFTLAFELGHLQLGKSSLSVDPMGAGEHGLKRRDEVWCSEFAIELLVPQAEIIRKKGRSELNQDELRNLANYFNVSNQIILLRLRSEQMISMEAFCEFWNKEKNREVQAFAAQAKKERARVAGAANYYDLVISRYGMPFTKALCESLAEGKTLFREAMDLLGVSGPYDIATIHARIQHRQ